MGKKGGPAPIQTQEYMHSDVYSQRDKISTAAQKEGDVAKNIAGDVFGFELPEENNFTPPPAAPQGAAVQESAEDIEGTEDARKKRSRKMGSGSLKIPAAKPTSTGSVGTGG